MEYRAHGGQCCGYGHVYGFDNATEVDLERAIEEHARAAGGSNRILEAILSGRQVDTVRWDGYVPQSVREAGGWPAILARKGFRLAAEWRNSNTGRLCYQFLKIDYLLTDGDGYLRAFNWDGPVVPAVRGVIPPAPQPVAPAPVVSREREYYATLRVGGRRGPFADLPAARAAYPRCGTFERRKIMSDGTSLWNVVGG